MPVRTLCVLLDYCGLITSAFRPDGEQGEMLGHFPLHPLGHPNYTALRARCVARSAGGAPSRPLTNSALRTSDTTSTFSPPVLRYSPA